MRARGLQVCLGVLALVAALAACSDDSDGTSSKQVQAGGAAPGAAGEQQLRFTAVKKGASLLDFAYSRSFEPGVPPAKTVTFDLEVV
jgi:hypothetical protein